MINKCKLKLQNTINISPDHVKLQSITHDAAEGVAE